MRDLAWLKASVLCRRTTRWASSPPSRSEGTGKSAVAHMIAHGCPAPSTRTTVGVNVLLTLLSYPAAQRARQPLAAFSGGSGGQQLYFLELFDVGAAERFAQLRPLWYTGLNGAEMRSRMGGQLEGLAGEQSNGCGWPVAAAAAGAGGAAAADVPIAPSSSCP